MKELTKMSLRAARQNLVPGIALQALALAAVAAYYWWDASAGFFNAIASLKNDYSFGYSAISTGLFGGVIPFCYLLATGKIAKENARSIGLFFLIFWTIRGVEVDLFYRWQAWIFGSEANFATVAKKVAFDQFVYCTIWAAPTTALAYRWMECDFSWTRFKAGLNKRFLTLEVPSVLVSIWIVWIPGTAAIYSLPSLLQLPVFNLVLCFYVLLISALDKTKG